MKTSFKDIFSITLIVSLICCCSGCVRTIGLYPQSAALGMTLENQKKLAQLNHWKITGAISVTHRGNRNVARFRWIQRDDDYQVYLFGPLNMGSIKIVGNSRGTELISDNGRIRASTLEQLLEKQFGYRIPENVMRHWILGLYSKIPRGYQVKFENYYYNQEKEVFLPKIIEIFHEATQIKIKTSGYHFNL